MLDQSNAEKPREPVRPRGIGVTWLAMGLSFAYLAVMAGLMWLFENALTLGEFTVAIGDPRRLNLWLLILLSAALIFVVTSWALGRISRRALAVGGPPSDLAPPADDGRRISWALLGLLALILAGTGSYVLRQQEQTVRAAQFRQIATVAALKSRMAARWAGERRRDVSTLLENHDFVANVQALVRPAARAADQARMPALDAMVHANGFVGAVIVDPRGEPRYSTPDDLQAREQCRLRARANDINPANPLEMTYAFMPSSGSPRIEAVGHVFADQAGRVAGHAATVCVRIDLADRLLPMMSDWPMPTRTGEILLGRIEGDDVLVLNTPRGGADRWTLQRMPAARARWQAAVVATEAGELRERDLSDGRTTLRAAFAVDGTPWLLVARMDAEEADGLQSFGQRRMAMVAGFAFVFAVAVAMLGWARGSARNLDHEHERDALIRRLQDLAYHDGLTGLPRRPLTEDRLQIALAGARRESGTVGVLFIDLDGFKQINDQHGHAAGDAALQFVAGRLSERLRAGDTVGRIGGDEFLVVLPGCGDAASMARLGERFVEAAHASFDWEGHALSLRASVGGARFPDDGDDATTLTAAADQAMFSAKQSGAGYIAAG